MDDIYIIFKCGSCRRTNIALAAEYKKAQNKNVYLTCMYCNCSHFKRKTPTNNLLECFKNEEKRK